MKRNITSTIEFLKNLIVINVIEKISTTNQVELFHDSAPIKQAHSFLEKAIVKISHRIGGKIKDVVIVIEPSKEMNHKTTLIKKKIAIEKNVVSQKDIDNLLKMVSINQKPNEKEIILVQPLLFEVESDVKKQYLEAPINKIGDYISSTIAISTIDKKFIDFVKNIIKIHKINIQKILLTTHTISQTKLSQAALKSGACLIHMSENQTFVTINKNGGTVASFVLYESGYKNFINVIEKTLKCSTKEAKDLMLIFGSLDDNVSKNVIYTKYEGINEINFTNHDLMILIKSFIKRLFSVINKYLLQKGVNNLPVVISGMLNKINNLKYLATNFFGKTTTFYQPNSYLEINNWNNNIIGVYLINDRLDGVLGKKLNSIVETNPNSFVSIKKNETKNIFYKMLNKLGGWYERRR